MLKILQKVINWRSMSKVTKLIRREFFENAWRFASIQDKTIFLKWVLSITPNRSVWIFDTLTKNLSQFQPPEAVKMWNLWSWSWPKHGSVVWVDERTRPDIISQIDGSGIEEDAFYHCIYTEDRFFFVSHDQLDPDSTWISKTVTIEQFRPLIEEGVIRLR